MKKILINIYNLFKDTIKSFFEDDSLMHGAALSYYSIFAIPSMLLVYIFIIGFFFGSSIVDLTVTENVVDYLGASTSDFLTSLVDNRQFTFEKNLTSVIAVVTILFSSTALFITLQRSLNDFWKVKKVIKTGFIKIIIDRLKSFVVLFILGGIMILSFVVKAIHTYFKTYFTDIHEHIFSFFDTSLTNLITIVMNSIVFLVLFKFLADVKMKWKVAIIGALFTGFLFSYGNELVTKLIYTIDYSSSFGAAGSVVLVLVWTYYCSMIVFFGAHFTYHLSILIKMPIKAKV